MLRSAAETRQRKLAQYIEMLERGDTIHPQGPRASAAEPPSSNVR
jgi:hypothetical protein